MTLRDGGYMKDIVSLIEARLGKGFTADQLRYMLTRQGYTYSAIKKGFLIAEQKRANMQQEKPKEIPKVIVIDSSMEEEQPKKGHGFFSKIKNFFTSSPPPSKEVKPTEEGFVKIDPQGNLVR